MSAARNQEADISTGISSTQNRAADISGPGIPPLSSSALLQLPLRKGPLRNVPRATLRAAARVLLHLAHNPGGRHSHKALGAVSGLSERGMITHMGSLRRRGLVVRLGFQRYALTPLALEIIAGVAAGPATA